MILLLLSIEPPIPKCVDSINLGPFWGIGPIIPTRKRDSMDGPICYFISGLIWVVVSVRFHTANIGVIRVIRVGRLFVFRCFYVCVVFPFHRLLQSLRWGLVQHIIDQRFFHNFTVFQFSIIFSPTSQDADIASSSDSDDSTSIEFPESISSLVSLSYSNFLFHA